MNNAILRVINEDYPEETRLVDCIFDKRLGDCMKVSTKGLAELALRHPEKYCGVFLDTLKVKLNHVRGPVLGNGDYKETMDTGVELVRLAKDKGLPVIVLSEASERDDPEILAMIKDADAIFEKPYNAEQVQGAIGRYFG